MIADPIPSDAALRAGEDVEAGFKPLGEAVCDLDSFVQLVIVGIQAILGSLESLEGEVAVQLNHGLMRRHGLVGIDLDFVVALAEEREREKKKQRQAAH